MTEENKAKYGEDEVHHIESIYRHTLELAKVLDSNRDPDNYELPDKLEFKDSDEVVTALIKVCSEANKVCAKILSVYEMPDLEADAPITSQVEIEITKEQVEQFKKENNI